MEPQTQFKKLLQNKSELAASTTEDIRSEYIRRELISDRFPLEVFHPAIRSFLLALHKDYDIPASFIGLTLLSALSTAIGTSYAATTNRTDLFYLTIWGAMVGISSSGKSMAMRHLYSPHNIIQDRFDEEWQQKTKGLSNEKVNLEKLQTIIFRDSHVPTLIRSVLPDNPKGIVKYSDELLEWINGMNQLSRKEGTDEQFWISSWKCESYNAIRSGKQKIVIKRPFVNIIGGTQYKVLPKFFSHDRDTSGFTFRLLFALPEFDRIAEPDPFFEMPAETSKPYTNCINRLYHNLPVSDFVDEPKLVLIQHDAIKLYTHWAKRKTKLINSVVDPDEQNIQAGILGKVKEYIIRFAAVLHLADRASDPNYGGDFHTNFKLCELIQTETMERAIALGEYFYKSSIKINEQVQNNITAPMDVLLAASMLRLGRNQTEIAEHLYGDRKYKMRVTRNLKKWSRDYPRVFNSLAK